MVVVDTIKKLCKTKVCMTIVIIESIALHTLPQRHGKTADSTDVYCDIE